MEWSIEGPKIHECLIYIDLAIAHQWQDLFQLFCVHGFELDWPSMQSHYQLVCGWHMDDKRKCWLIALFLLLGGDETRVDLTFWWYILPLSNKPVAQCYVVCISHLVGCCKVYQNLILQSDWSKAGTMHKSHGSLFRRIPVISFLQEKHNYRHYDLVSM